MFQSLAGDFKEKNHSKDVNFNGEDIKATLKKLFSIPNIIIYVISFLISIVSFGGDVSLGIHRRMNAKIKIDAQNIKSAALNFNKN